MKKFIKIISLIVVVVTICLVCFVDCDKKTCSIPDGLYGWRGDIEDDVYTSVYKLTENEDVRGFYAIEIDGDIAKRWTSGSVDYKAKIVERDGEIYFEGYKWRDFWDIIFRDGAESGITDIYKVTYDDVEKSMILIYLGRN